LAEALLPAGVGCNRRLERIGGLIDWARMERLLAPLRAPTGRPGYPPLALFRALLLAQRYRLSDPGLEEALADRLSFRRFCGLGLDDSTPDETTLCRFTALRALPSARGTLAERDLAEALFAEVNRQLDERGPMLTAGPLIDATLVEAAVARRSQSEGAVPTKDPEAGITDGIMRRAHARRPLAPWQRWMNRALAPIRARVERSFGTLKRSYGWRRVRYRGLARNGAHLHLLCTALNLRRRAERLAA
jgi:IS5 family transposase